MTSGRHQGRRGLTLIEVMVAVALTTVMIAGVYMIYSKSVVAFRTEGQVLNMQDRLRFGLEHLKRDIRRAGFLATPNSQVDANICPEPSDHLRAVTIDDDDGSVVASTVNLYVQPSSITLFGDFFSGQVYRTTGISGAEVFLDGGAPNFPANELEFQRVFCGVSCAAPNRYLRIVTRDQFEVMLEINSAVYESSVGPYVELSQAVPRVGGGNRCGITGLGEGLEVNVAGFVRYRIAFDERPNAPTASEGAGGGAIKTDLIREELDTDGETEVASTQLVIADYAVDLEFYDFGFDTSGAAALPSMTYHPLVSAVVGGTNPERLDNSLNATPEELRVLTVKLTLRADEEDPSHPLDPRDDLFEPLEGYEIDTGLQGSCRTLSLACKVGLTSLLARNLSQGGP